MICEMIFLGLHEPQVIYLLKYSNYYESIVTWPRTYQFWDEVVQVTLI